MRAGAAAAAALVSLTPVVELVKFVRIGLFTDPDPSWILARVALHLLAIGLAVASFRLVYRGLLALERTPVVGPLAELPFGRGALTAIAGTALAAGAALRLWDLAGLPEILFIDDVSLLGPAAELTQTFRDFRDAIRPAPFGVPKIFGTVGVLYLQGMRVCMDLADSAVLGLRLPSALGGIASLVTGTLLGRALLPRGGGALTGLVLAGLRWHLIMSRWAWNMIVLAPVVDAATLLILSARRKDSAGRALAAGVVAGLGAHVYLSAWTAGAALAALAAWPREALSLARRAAMALVFATGFALAAAPLFLFAEGRPASYWVRTRDHNVWKEIRMRRSTMPVFSGAADSLKGPWLVGDPLARNDLPGRSRLGLVLGLAFAAACARALLRPRDELSALLLAHAATGLASSIAGGEAQTPNGCRYAYLVAPTAVAVSAGVLAFLGAVRQERRRLAALLWVGAVAVLGTLGARDALVRWAPSRAYYDDICGQDTALGRVALRWEHVGPVIVEPELPRSPLVLEGIRRFRLDPRESRWGELLGPARRGRHCFRIASAGTVPRPGEKAVERVRDGWGRDWAVVLGRKQRGYPFGVSPGPFRTGSYSPLAAAAAPASSASSSAREK